MELKRILEIAKKDLKDHSQDPLREAQMILVDYFGFDRIDFAINLEKDLSLEETKRFLSILTRRKNDEPLAYIMEEAYFLGIPFYVNKNVLIPRHDTERSVEVLLELIESKMTVLEIGVGSGCVSIYCGLKNRDSLFHGVDISVNALEVANRNKEKYSVSNVDFFQSDLFSNINHTYDIIYSNPPYIPSNDINKLMNSVKDHEPLLALDGGPDGLDFYRNILKESKKHLNPNGKIAFEIGYNQKESLIELFHQYDFIDVELLEDYQHYPRVIWGKVKG